MRLAGDIIKSKAVIAFKAGSGVFMSSTQTSTRTLLALSLLSRAAYVLLLTVAGYLPQFDVSHKALLSQDNNSRLIDALLRWDAFHFAHIAKEGYVYEHQWAFLPGAPFVMRLSSHIFSFLGIYSSNQWESIIAGGALTAVTCDTTISLYKLSLHHLKSPRIAYLAALVSLIPSSPAVLRFASYGEPFFAFFSYRGMLSCTRRNYVSASLYFACAATFRSNGTLLCGFIIWDLAVEPFLRENKLSTRRFAKAALLSAFVIAPFVIYNYIAYKTFCLSDTAAPAAPWCTRAIPSIYTYAQSKYWDVGFLRYWTPPQIPNILLGLPPLLLVAYFSVGCISQQFSALYTTLSSHPPHPSRQIKEGDKKDDSSLVSGLSALPYAIHALILAFALLFSAHTQISLRLVPSATPVVHWAAAQLLVDDSKKNKNNNRKKWGKVWTYWAVIWSAVACILWTTGLPPA